MGRSEKYITALSSFDLTNATTSSEGRGTMPGVTTALVGGLARELWGALDRWGVIDPGVPFTSSRSGLVLAQLGMAAANAMLVVVLWWVLRHWLSSTVATAATVIIATEPFLVTHGARLTTDAFVTLFGAIGAFGLAAALGVPNEPRGSPRSRRLLAVVAGLGLGGAFASKLSAVTLGPFLIAVLAVAYVRARGTGRLRELVRTTAIAAVAACAFVIVIWPALWADPGGQLAVLRGSSTQVGVERAQFFAGEITTSPGPLFHLAVVLFRTTPWLLLFGVAGAVTTLVDRQARLLGFVLLGFCVVPLVTITVATLKYDRYVLPIWPALAVLAGLFVERALSWWAMRRSDALASALAAGGVAFVIVSALLVVPDAAVYTNPVAGGAAVAEDVVLVGGASSADVGELIRDREGAVCSSRRVYALSFRRRLRFPCGDLVGDPARLRPGDYIVLDAPSIKRMPRARVDEYRELGDPVARIERRGVHLADVIQVR
jgi:4-amino-4-deoxy-L-arabinose transferase-like glycosyltransferase